MSTITIAVCIVAAFLAGAVFWLVTARLKADAAWAIMLAFLVALLIFAAGPTALGGR